MKWSIHEGWWFGTITTMMSSGGHHTMPGSPFTLVFVALAGGTGAEGLPIGFLPWSPGTAWVEFISYFRKLWGSQGQDAVTQLLVLFLHVALSSHLFPPLIPLCKTPDSLRRTEAIWITIHCVPSQGVCAGETFPWSNATPTVERLEQHGAFFTMPEECISRRKHCILRVTSHTCQVGCPSVGALSTRPNSLLSSLNRSWFLEHWLNGKCKVCTDKYRSSSPLMAELLACSWSCYMSDPWQGFVLHSRHKQAPGIFCHPHTLCLLSSPCTNTALCSFRNARTWTKWNNSTIQFRFSLGNILIFWLNNSRKDTGLVLNPTGLLAVCI